MEHSSIIPCCYHPTTVTLIDDDERFLQSLSFKLGTHLNCKTFSNSTKAIQFLKQDYQFRSFAERCLSRPEEQSRDHRNLEINVREIHQEIYNPNRFNEISVVVVDYAMPTLNGAEVCYQLKQNSNFKIILLTGEASEQIAVELFNKNVIERFIRKDDIDFAKKLEQSIHELQEEYFKYLSEIVITSLTKHPEHPPSCLDDPTFISFFKKLVTKYQPTEYYLMDSNGSFMFFDINAIPSWLVVKDEGEMRGWHEMAELADTEVPVTILESMKNREKILYLHSDQDFKTNPIQWQKYLHPTKRLEGKITYYYSYIDNPEAYDINPKQIVSYKKFLSSI